jgi:hypothetical protein
MGLSLDHIATYAVFGNTTLLGYISAYVTGYCLFSDTYLFDWLLLARACCSRRHGLVQSSHCVSVPRVSPMYNVIALVQESVLALDAPLDAARVLCCSQAVM